MICAACREAPLYASAPVEYREEAIRKGHAECKGGTWCDCQHQLPRPMPR